VSESFSAVFLSFLLISSTSVSILQNLTSTQEIVFIEFVSEILSIFSLSQPEKAIYINVKINKNVIIGTI